MLRQLEHDATMAVKAGVGMRNDLLQVQLRQNEVESNRIKLDNGLRLARRVLAQYIGAGDETDAADCKYRQHAPISDTRGEQR